MISQKANLAANYFKIALLNLRSNISGNIFAFSIMSFSFFIILFSFLFYVNVYHYMDLFRKNNTMVVFFGKNAKYDNNAVNYIKKIKGVKSIKYFNDRSSLNFLEKRITHIKTVLKNINPKLIPTFLKVNFKKKYISKIYISNVYLRLKSLKGVKFVYFNKLLEDKVIQFMFFTKIIGLIIFIFLFILATFISYSAIKLIILRKQNEIEILRLIGATNFYIRVPMFIESLSGAIISFFAALLLLFLIFKLFIYYHFNDFLSYFHIKVIFLNFQEIFFIFAMSAASGFIGTYISSKKFFYDSKE